MKRLEAKCKINESQLGFQKGKSSVMQNMTLELLLLKNKEDNNKIVMFLDIEKAYDSVNSCLLLKKMLKP